jgi:cyclohexadieny/prephenate dehydrogenase
LAYVARQAYTPNEKSLLLLFFRKEDSFGFGLMPVLFERVAILGFGLIGGSIARALRARPGLAGEIVACEKAPAALARVVALGIADRVTASAVEAVAGADLVILCTPVGVYAELAAEIAPHLAAGAILSDVGSTKQSVLRDVGPLVPAGVHFVPAHPLAGTEHSGPDAGFAALFEGRWCLLTPPPGTDADSVARVQAFWRGLGSMVEIMEPAHHDRVLAIVSHLPHLIAFTICGTADDLADETRQQVLQFAATGFRDFTRIAASDPTMWRDVFLNNREALLEMLARFTEDAQAMARAVRWGDAAYIEDRIGRGRKIRRSLIELKQA